MRNRDSTEGNIIRVGAALPALPTDAYVIDLRYDNFGVRRSHTSQLVAPLLPEANHTTAITPYQAPGARAIIRAASSEPGPASAARFGRTFAALSLIVLGIGAYAAIRVQRLSHELAVERRAADAAKAELAGVQARTAPIENRNVTAARLREADARARAVAEQVALRNNALLAAGSGAADDPGIAQLRSYIARLSAGTDSLDTLSAMGGLLAARDLPAQAEMCYVAVLSSPQCTRPQRLLALAGVAESAARQGRFPEADSLYRDLIDLERADRQLTPRALHHLAEHIKIKIRRDLPDDAGDGVSAMFARLAGDRADSLEPAFVRQTLLSLTDAAIEHGHPEIAIRLLDRALFLTDASSSATAAAPFRQMLLTLHAQNGSELEARRLMKKFLQQQKKELGDTPEVANTAMQLAALDEQLGDLYGAEKTLQLALTIRERTFGNDHPDVADTAYALARVYERQGRRSESEALLGLVKGIWARKRTSESNELNIGGEPDR